MIDATKLKSTVVEAECPFVLLARLFRSDEFKRSMAELAKHLPTYDPIGMYNECNAKLKERDSE